MGLPLEAAGLLNNKYERGKRNKITDVAGIKVGHVTIDDEEKNIHTGVTAVIPHPGNTFREKLPAGTAVINGFGKSTGLIQIDELGTLETPIVMTNTLSVGTALTALVKYMLERNKDIGTLTGTVNCVVTECNDGSLNDIRGLHVTEKHVFQALENCSEDFEEGAVGSGRGMICMGLKGGIGSSSRMVQIDEQRYTIGALVMSNFGVFGNLRIDGKVVDVSEEKRIGGKEKGSVIILLATDIPMNDRQLRRVARRSVVGLGRTGSYLGNGSGDIAIAFSTADKIPHYSKKRIITRREILDDAMDPVFEAAAEAVEEAVISSLYHSEGMTGIRKNTVHGVREYLP